MTLLKEDHDQRLKEAVKSKFSDAIDLMLPTWLSLFDFSRLEWIEQEIFPDPPKGLGAPSIYWRNCPHFNRSRRRQKKHRHKSVSASYIWNWRHGTPLP